MNPAVRSSLDDGKNNSREATAPETEQSALGDHVDLASSEDGDDDLGRYDCREIYRNIELEAEDGDIAPFRCNSWDCYCCAHRMRCNLVEELDRLIAERPELRRLLTITLDPETDVEARINEYCDRLGVDRGVDNWYFLRPESPERARAVVDDTFGVAYEGGGGHYEHASLILLVNKDGIIERAYNGGPPEPGAETKDARMLIEEW